MRHALTLHPDSRCEAVARIEVDVLRPGPKSLALRYLVTGNIRDLSLPPVKPSARADNLWQHTCFEAFLRPSLDTAYFEFNFAPSAQWAAYRFSGYREGMSAPDEISAPRIEVRSDPERFELRALLELDGLSNPPGDEAWRLALSAVIEEASERKSYWALAHAPGNPDFHYANNFALDLAKAETP